MPQLGFRHISSPDQLLLQDLSDAALRIAAKVAKLPELEVEALMLPMMRTGAPRGRLFLFRASSGHASHRVELLPSGFYP
jgi:hypothetical protein